MRCFWSGAVSLLLLVNAVLLVRSCFSAAAGQVLLVNAVLLVRSCFSAAAGNCGTADQKPICFSAAASQVNTVIISLYCHLCTVIRSIQI